MNTKQFYSIIIAKDYEKTVEFYNMLGFTKKHENMRPFSKMCIMENEAKALIEIMEKTDEKAVDGVNMEIPGLMGIRTNVKDLDEAIKEFEDSGTTIVAGPMEMSVGRGMIVKDPNGVQITVIQHISKKN